MSELHTTFPAGAGLLGRVVDATGAPLDGHGPLRDVRPAALAPLAGPGAPGPLWETGVKVIDCFAPLALGGSTALLASPGVGLMVAMTELVQRLAAQRGGCAVVAELDDEAYPIAETSSMLREGGIERQTALITAPADAPLEHHERLALAALAAAEGLFAQGKHVLLVLGDGLVTERTAPILRGRARAAAAGSLSLLLDFWRHITPEPALGPEAATLVAEVQARLSFSRDLARQGIWPAIDPLASSSRLLEGDRVSEEHRRVAGAARELLRQLQLPPGSGDPAALARARRLLLFGGQPFFVAEPYTAKPGVHVPLEATLRGYGELAAGLHDELEEAAVSFTGAL
jgi:F-type H+-transporting ATPase subunit beta